MTNRKNILDLLVSEWRKAENYYLENEDDSWKWFMKELQDALNLTDNERGYVEVNCNAIGV